MGECIETLKGFAFKSQWYKEEGVPIIKVSDFSDDSISTDNLTFIPESIAKDYDKYRIHANDIIIQTVGSWPRNPKSVVGKAIRVPHESGVCSRSGHVPQAVVRSGVPLRDRIRGSIREWRWRRKVTVS